MVVFGMHEDTKQASAAGSEKHYSNSAVQRSLLDITNLVVIIDSEVV